MTDPPRRVNFVAGQLLTAEDLQAEQDYHRGMRYLHNRLHGHGVVEGLEISAGEGGVHVGPGVGIDVLGRELVVSSPRIVEVGAVAAGADGTHDLLLTWDEVPDRMMTGPDGVEVCSRYIEQPAVTLAPSGAAPPEALVLGRLTRERDGAVSADPSVRRLLDPACRGPQP